MLKRIFKWVFRIVILLILGIVIFGTIKQAIYDSNVESEFQATGDFSNIGENKIHYTYLNKGDFTLIMIGGMGESMHTWSTVADDLNQRGRVFMYDRSGLGFSAEGILPRSVDNVAIELHTVIKNENIPGPYLLVGHSAGGFIARYYAKKYPKDVVGLYLLDPYNGDVGANDLPEEWPLSFKMMNWSFRKTSWSGIPFFLLPNPPHPTYKTSKAIKTYGNEAYAEKISLEQFKKLDGVGKEMPLYLLRADNGNVKYNDLNHKWHKQIFDTYSNDINKFLTVKSGHHIHLQKPEVFLKTLDEFLTKLEML
ncbi:MAG: alpha/beta hydrolase [Bacteroidota bacterium]